MMWCHIACQFDLTFLDSTIAFLVLDEGKRDRNKEKKGLYR